MDKKVILWVAVIATIIGVLFWIPATQHVIILILPLGSGTDDAIVIGAVIIAGVFWLFWTLQKRRRDKRDN